MPEDQPAPELFDLKFLPAWVKETPNENRYADFTGEEEMSGRRDRSDRDGRGGERRERRPRPPRAQDKGRDPRSRDRRPPAPRSSEPRRQESESPPTPPPAVEVRFVPAARVLENVLPQIKSGHLAYSIFALARMFLDKPERYDVRLKAESAPLYQLGELGPVAADRRFLENGAFVSQKDQFYKTEVTQTEPIKGNFTSVARCRLSGTLLGPTNHHAYQPQLRALYEQRFSRRMSFPEYQRQIEIVNDPEIVERWKDEARSVTTYTTLQEDPPVTFNNAAETERHFRQVYLPGLIQEGTELVLDGVPSRRLPDRSLGRLIEDQWAQEFRSPTKMMQELIGAFRQSGLHIFRHRKGMLFVSAVRPRPFTQDAASLSTAVAAVLAILRESPGLNRKQLLEKLPAEEAADAAALEKRKLGLASNLHWLIREGHVIEFNDGTLDLPRAKAPAPTPTASARPVATPPPAPSPNESTERDETMTPTAETVAPVEAPATPEPTAATEASEADEADAAPDSTAPIEAVVEPAVEPVSPPPDAGEETNQAATEKPASENERPEDERVAFEKESPVTPA